MATTAATTSPAGPSLVGSIAEIGREPVARSYSQRGGLLRREEGRERRIVQVGRLERAPEQLHAPIEHRGVIVTVDPLRVQSCRHVLKPPPGVNEWCRTGPVNGKPGGHIAMSDEQDLDYPQLFGEVAKEAEPLARFRLRTITACSTSRRARSSSFVPEVGEASSSRSAALTLMPERICKTMRRCATRP